MATINFRADGTRDQRFRPRLNHEQLPIYEGIWNIYEPRVVGLYDCEPPKRRTWQEELAIRNPGYPVRVVNGQGHVVYPQPAWDNPRPVPGSIRQTRGCNWSLKSNQYF